MGPRGWLLHASGRPRGWVRRLLFRGRRPRPGFGWLVLDRAGAARPAFAAWMAPVLAPPLPGFAGVQVLKAGPVGAQDDMVVLVVYSADGQLSELQRAQVQAYVDAGRRVALVINSARFPVPPDGLSPADIVLLRENRGFDFGGWRDALRAVPGIAGARSLAFTNDSVLSLSDAALRAMLARAAGAAQDVVFLTQSREHAPHAQSYFFLMHRRALQGGALTHLTAIGDQATKEALIQQGELRLSQSLADAGFSIAVLFDSLRAANPTIAAWEALARAGFPFLKLQLFETGLLSLDDPRVTALLPQDRRAAVAAHLRARAGSGG